MSVLKEAHKKNIPQNKSESKRIPLIFLRHAFAIPVLRGYRVSSKSAEIKGKKKQLQSYIHMMMKFQIGTRITASIQSIGSHQKEGNHILVFELA